MASQERELKKREALGGVEPWGLRVGNPAKFARPREVDPFKGAGNASLGRRCPLSFVVLLHVSAPVLLTV